MVRGRKSPFASVFSNLLSMTDGSKVTITPDSSIGTIEEARLKLSMAIANARKSGKVRTDCRYVVKVQSESALVVACIPQTSAVSV